MHVNFYCIFNYYMYLKPWQMVVNGGVRLEMKSVENFVYLKKNPKFFSNKLKTIIYKKKS